MQSSSFKNIHLVLEKKQDVLNRIYEIAGTTNHSKIAKSLDIAPGAFGNWANKNSNRKISLQ